MAKKAGTSTVARKKPSKRKPPPFTDPRWMPLEDAIVALALQLGRLTFAARDMSKSCESRG